ncbi:MAG: methionyl-tRNA formyltransferase [Desulfobacteraceae bacterium]|jgi:methionyl-tRNA formyltransferase
MDALSRDRLHARPGIVFMGTPDFAVPTLRSLLAAGLDVRSVVTQPDRPKGRGKRTVPSPVKRFALDRDIEVLQPESVNTESFLDVLRECAPDLFVVVAFGQILKGDLLAVPRWGVLNVHASLLPRYRGAAPIQRAILNDEARTGLTLMRMEEGLDTGPVLFREAVEIAPEETAGSLHDRLADLAGERIVEWLEALAKEPVREILQDAALATYAPKIDRETMRVEWSEPARKVSARIRALDPHPGARTTHQGQGLKLFAAGVADEREREHAPGRVTVEADRLLVSTGCGRVVVREIQASGKRRMPIADFLRGFSMGTGSLLGT